MSKIADGLLYSESHEWVKMENGIATVGITDFAQKSMGNIVYVDMPEPDDEVSQNEEFGAVESVKAASDLYSPISGIVTEVNEALDDEPGLLNKDAYANWIIKVKISEPAELETLMDAAAYTDFLAKEA